jgi:hypothetical protein
MRRRHRERMNSRDRGIGCAASSPKRHTSWLQGWPVREDQPLVPLFDLAAAVDDKGHFLPVFHRFDSRTFGAGFDFPDLRIARSSLATSSC